MKWKWFNKEEKEVVQKDNSGIRYEEHSVEFFLLKVYYNNIYIGKIHRSDDGTGEYLFFYPEYKLIDNSMILGRNQQGAKRRLEEIIKQILFFAELIKTKDEKESLQ